MDLRACKEAYDRDGFVKIPGLIAPAELEVLRAETGRIVEEGWQGKFPAHHYFHHSDAATGEEIFHRVQFVFAKSALRPNPFLALLGHPGLLRIAAALFGGEPFGLSGEALVFKLPRNGKAVPVHTDGAEGRTDLPAHESYFNADVYLDDSTPENGCLLAAPGSHRRNAREEIARLGFEYPGLTPVTARAGDVIFHNTRVVHGSHASRSLALRRTLYYEFRSLRWMESPEHAGHMGRPGEDFSWWIAARARLLEAGQRERRGCAYAAGEAAFAYELPERWRARMPAGELDLAPSFGGSYF